MMQRDIAKNMHGEVPPLAPECGVGCKAGHDGAETSTADDDASTDLFDNYGTINTEGEFASRPAWALELRITQQLNT